MKAYRGRRSIAPVTLLTSVLDGVGGQLYAPVTLTRGKNPGIHELVAKVGRRAGLDASRQEKMPGLELRTIHPIVDYIKHVSE
jgi:hypothetical protein